MLLVAVELLQVEGDEVQVEGGAVQIDAHKRVFPGHQQFALTRKCYPALLGQRDHSFSDRFRDM